MIAPRSSNPGFIQTGETGPTYAVQVTLRNSGARDAAPLWVAISEDTGSVNDFAGKRMIARLPKDDEQTLTFDLVEKPSEGNWEVAYAYLDEVPADQNEDPGSPTQLTFECPGISFVQLDSRPKEGVTDSGLRILSVGSPFMMEPMTEGPYGPEAKTTAQGLRNELYALISNEPACRPKQ